MILYLVAGLLVGVGTGFMLGVRQAERRAAPTPPVETVHADTLALGQTQAELVATQVRLGELDRELATLKVAHQALQNERQAEQGALAQTRAALARAEAENGRLHDVRARLERELALRAEVLEPASPVRPEQPTEPDTELPQTAAGLPVRILQTDEAQQVLALDRGRAAGLEAGSRWTLRGPGPDLAIVLTEVREHFAIARRVEPSNGPALELASDQPYRITPLP